MKKIVQIVLDLPDDEPAVVPQNVRLGRDDSRLVLNALLKATMRERVALD